MSYGNQITLQFLKFFKIIYDYYFLTNTSYNFLILM